MKAVYIVASRLDLDLFDTLLGDAVARAGAATGTVKNIGYRVGLGVPNESA